MVSKAQIDSLSRRTDELIRRLAPAPELPPCPPIKLGFGHFGGNTPGERELITTHVDRAIARGYPIKYEVSLEFREIPSLPSPHKFRQLSDCA